jgi:PAS domain S-box-containing protein
VNFRLLSLIENAPAGFQYRPSIDQKDVKRWPFALLASKREDAEAALAPHGTALAGIIVTFGTEQSFLQRSELLFHLTVPHEQRANLLQLLHSHLVLLENCQQAENRNKVAAQELARADVDSQRNRLEFALTKESLVEELSVRRRAEEELIKQKNLISTIIESTSEAIYAKDTSGKYIFINESGARMLGSRATDVFGHTDMELLPAETAREFRTSDEYIMLSGQSFKREETGIIDGKTYFFLSHKSPWRDNSGKIIGVIGVSNDITDRKLAEVRLQESSRWMRFLTQGRTEQSSMPTRRPARCSV